LPTTFFIKSLKLAQNTRRLCSPGERPQANDLPAILARAYLDTAYQLRSLVGEIENSPQFTALCGGSAGTKNPLAEIRKNQFRRSGFYLKSFNGKRPSAEKLFTLIVTPRKRIRATRLTIFLDDVVFASKAIDFGTFKIQDFTKSELDILTEQVINEIFMLQSVPDKETDNSPPLFVF